MLMDANALVNSHSTLTSETALATDQTQNRLKRDSSRIQSSTNWLPGIICWHFTAIVHTS